MSGTILPDRHWQADAWFPSAGQGDSSDTPGRHLAGKLTEIRKILPLPLEQVLSADVKALAALSEKVRQAAGGAVFIQLAHQLSSRELDLIFPLLALQEPSSRTDIPLIDRLILIIRERACPTLYASGWLVFQKAYPSRIIARSLHVLCKILEIKHQTGSSSGSETSSLPPMISPVASPESRQLVRRLVRHLDTAEIVLEQLMDRFHILDDLPFGAELIARTFISSNADIYQESQQLFGKALKHARQSTQVDLLRHFFSQSELPPNIRNRCCQQIYRRFGDPAGESPVWRQLRPKDRRAFREWVFAATIGTHCRQLPQKARLYQRYASQIRKIERWNEDTLLIHFTGFLVADSNRSPMLAIYYDQAKSGEHPFELASEEFRPNPADPAIPHRQVDDAIRNSNFKGIIGLPFDSEGIRLTGTFLGLCLRDKPKGLFSTFISRPA